MPKKSLEPVSEIPAKIQKWISDFCSGKASVNVGHMMFAVKENLTNIQLENALNLIRTDRAVDAYIAGNDARMTQVAEYTASCVYKQVIASFSRAAYPGD